MLRKEYRHRDCPEDCNVYYTQANDGGHYYYFSPPAARQYAEFVDFWQGQAIYRPGNLKALDPVV